MASKLYTRLIQFIIIFHILILCAVYVKSETTMIEMPIDQALKLYKSDDLLIIDIRTKTEWKHTGVIPNSLLVSMHDQNHIERSEFIKEVTIILDKNKNKKVSFICASGARSKMVTSFFRDKGYDYIFDINEGILGSNNDGWFYLGYPLISYMEN